MKSEPLTCEANIDNGKAAESAVPLTPAAFLGKHTLYHERYFFENKHKVRRSSRD